MSESERYYAHFQAKFPSERSKRQLPNDSSNAIVSEWKYPHEGSKTIAPNIIFRAIVAERFREIRDYADPKRLFGNRELLKRSSEETADFGDPNAMHSVPLSEYILRSLV